MEAIKCSRCGAFYTTNYYVCPKCTNKDNFELSTFKNFVEQDMPKEIPSLDKIAYTTGISEKNLNRFLDYKGFEKYKKLFK